MKKLIGLLLISGSLQVALAQDITSGILNVQEEVHQYINDRSSINYPLYPDYNQAVREVQVRFDKVVEYVLPDLTKIEEKAHQFQQGLDEVKTSYNQNQSVVLKKIIEQKENIEGPKLARELNQIYQSKIKDLITIWQDFVVVTGIKKHKTSTDWQEMSGIIHDYIILDNFNETLGSRNINLGLLLYSSLKFEELTKKEAHDNIARFTWERSSETFYFCKTTGCVYELAEDIKNYFDIISKINVKVSLAPIIKLTPVKFPKEESKQGVDKMAVVGALRKLKER